MTILLEILAVAAVVFVAASFVVGRFDGMAAAPPDVGDDNLPAGRLASHTVDRARFGLAFRGYRMAEVDGVLDRLRDELADRDTELDALRGSTEESQAHAAPEAPGSGELFSASAADEPPVTDGQLTLGEQ